MDTLINYFTRGLLRISQNIKQGFDPLPKRMHVLLISIGVPNADRVPFS